MIIPVRPLQWNGPQTKASARVDSFSATWSSTQTLLHQELRALRATNPVLQLDVTDQMIRLDGQIRAAATPSSPAVRLVFDTRKHGTLSYQCDRQRKWQGNVRAIALGLEALRMIDRYGIAETGQQTYMRDRELSEGDLDDDDWGRS